MSVDDELPEFYKTQQDNSRGWANRRTGLFLRVDNFATFYGKKRVTCQTFPNFSRKRKVLACQ